MTAAVYNDVLKNRAIAIFRQSLAVGRCVPKSDGLFEIPDHGSNGLRS